LVGHEVVVTGVVRDTFPEMENRGVVFVSCRHLVEECETCRREAEEREAAERRREENRRREELKREAIRKYGLGVFVVGNPDRDCPRAYEVLRNITSIDDPRLLVLSEIAKKYSEWAKVRYEVYKIEDHLAKLQHAPGCEDLWKQFCSLDDKKSEHEYWIRKTEEKVRELEEQLKGYSVEEVFKGDSQKERILRRWSPRTGGVESTQRLEWDPMAVPRYEVEDEGPWAKWPQTWEPEPGMWKWKTVEMRASNSEWAAAKAAEYEELRHRLEETKAELARLQADEEYARLKAEFSVVCEKLAEAREAYKKSLLGDLSSESKRLWAEMKELEEKL